MTTSQYATLPERQVVRELRYPVGQPGFRVSEVTLVTTLLDPDDWRQLDFPVLPHHRMLPRIAPLGATKCPAFWPFGSTRPSLRDHNFTKVGELELDKRQARSNTGFPGNHHA